MSDPKFARSSVDVFFKENSHQLAANEIARSFRVTEIETVKNIEKHLETDGGILTNEQIEKMLSAQATLLNAQFFVEIRAAGVLAADPKSDILNYISDRYDTAFRLQNACRKSLESLHSMRNPKKTTFVKTAIASQNNTLITTPQQELGECHAQSLDGITEATTERTHQELATVDAIDRSHVPRGKGKGKQKQL